MDIRPTPRFCALIYSAIEHDPTGSWSCNRATGVINKDRDDGPYLSALIRHFEHTRPDDVVAIERDVPERWPDDESSLGFVCLLP